MIVIFEGVDGAGKTTLAREVSKRMNMPVYKPPSRDPGEVNAAMSQAEDDGAWGVIFSLAGWYTDVDIILDRAYPSEYAYGIAFDRKIDTRLWSLDEEVSKHHAIIFWLAFASEDEWMPRSRDVSLARYRKLHEAYQHFFSCTRVPNVSIPASLPTRKQLAVVNRMITSLHRPKKDDTYMGMAEIVARRSTCLARRVGAVLVSESGHVIATGYNGAPTGLPHQKGCERLESNVKSGTGLYLCMDVHAEENCIVQAALQGVSTVGSKLYTLVSPCNRCMRMLINAEVRSVVYKEEYFDPLAFELGRLANVELRRIDERGL